MLNENRLILNNDNLRESISKLIKCNLCQKILNDPYDCLCCNLTYCYSCISGFIIKNRKCPNETITEYITEETEYECKIRPSASNINNFINSLQFHCSNIINGCNEELEYNNITFHELCCPFGRLDDPRESLMRNCSIVSFRNKNDLKPSENLENTIQNKTSDVKLNEKLDRIMDQLNHIRISIGDVNTSRLNTSNEYVTETPKFSLGFHPRNDSSYMRNKISNEKINFNNNTFYSQNINTAMDYQKIVCVLDNLNEKITNMENKLSLSDISEDKNIKKVEQSGKNIKNNLGKIEDDVGNLNKGYSTPYKSVNHTVNDSINSQNSKQFLANSPPKEKILVKKNTKSLLASPPAVKKIMIKSKIDSKSNLTNSPIKNNSPSKEISKISNKKIVPKLLCNDSIENNLNPNHFNHNLNTETKLLDVNDIFRTILNKLDSSVKEINNSYEMSNLKFKEYLKEEFTKELKNCFLEITLDSYNVYIDKIEEMFKRLN